MFGQSTIHAKLAAGEFGEFILIGDSGYANTPFLATPFSRREKRNAADFSVVDHEYQRAIISTRNTVERAFGVLKRRFPVLHSGMQLHRVRLIQLVVSCCCILHNICIDSGDTIMDDFPDLPPVVPTMVSEEEFIPTNEQPTNARRRARAPVVPKARDVILRIYEQRVAANVRIPTAEERLRRRMERHWRNVQINAAEQQPEEEQQQE